MKPLNANSNPPAKCAFGASLSPINRANCITFGLLDRFCCLGVMAIVMMLMRLFLAK
jgi:hypothetical protein